MLDRLLFSAVIGLSVVAVAFGPSRASAQRSKGSISGRVVMSKGGTPVPGARIFLTNVRKRLATDSVGRFVFEGLNPGAYRIEASLIGFAPLSAVVSLAAGERKDIEFRADTLGQLLPTIFVEGEPEPVPLRVITTFERRMSVGMGRFITRDDIVKRNPIRLIDMIRFLPGVRSDCRGSICQVSLNHDRSGCPPAIFVDDQRTSLAVLDITPPSDVEGVEVYRGAAETPPELNNEVARCGGAIAIWTRRGKRFEN